jgi:S1-C subfamily serine protease
VTNAHVLKGAWAIKLTGETGENLKFEGLCGYDERLDIAVINFSWGDYHNIHTANLEDWQGLHLAVYQPSIGQRIYVAGHPLGLGFTFSEGMISALYRSCMQISAAISHGSSGSPILDASGRVIGVAVGLNPNGENINFALPVSNIEAAKHPGAPCPKLADYRDYSAPSGHHELSDRLPVPRHHKM